jgi:hypothetical protein
LDFALGPFGFFFVFLTFFSVHARYKKNSVSGPRNWENGAPPQKKHSPKALPPKKNKKRAKQEAKKQNKNKNKKRNEVCGGWECRARSKSGRCTSRSWTRAHRPPRSH